ncbi:TNF receptor-associated factor 3-like [Mya arenaria]|uniref:TNF receptor-associated factor 3-like n=1 Tax=Mya arenaria TaxID=6604 RepID=UPI0022E3ADF6|nr:TNF receptor-associated factor 3-like [Mya arenaria]XP_052768382.1 TNF receptor-associated factor 3-like [Mya arenaria]XP_052768383.1 TNF receptor-associated factor 3-like [Mya arenaria]XP_052768385.1 TNF receptor-associated factor 3-like [Mya arenaria]XP_052768386.1 TNF receptor-associated factor 3-like [Mya arenaria]XP_052768387.1 TNF receptor-associated factor 3-like [Mya arenaria]XP_052768388.1 TNF receptor-associated factor 3-like [Mya arenaria]
MSISSIVTPGDIPQFVRLDSKHQCYICRHVVRNSMQTSCGHRICEECAPKLFEGKEEPVKCPAGEVDCEDLYRKDITPDPGGRREVRNLLVYCNNNQLGCVKQVKWIELDRHAESCEYRPVSCPHEHRGCTEKLPHNSVERHANKDCEFRPFPCKYCAIDVPLKYTQEHLQKQCEEVPLDCPYKCGAKRLKRQQLNAHMETCGRRPKECSFNGIGCLYQGTEVEVSAHMRDQTDHHLQKLTLFTQEMDLKHLEFQRKVTDMNDEQEKMKTDVRELKQKVERITNSNKEGRLKMVNLTERVIHLEKVATETARKDVVETQGREIVENRTAMAQVRTQLTAVERLVQELKHKVETGGGGAEVAELTRKVASHESQFANIDIQMAELDLRFQILETASYDGLLLWKVRDYTRRKADALAGRTLSLYSQPFYTHRYGYKMCSRVYLNGDGMGKNSHMSLFFVIMKGEFDNLLPWPFRQKVTMQLLDQDSGQTNLTDSFQPDPTSSSFKKPSSDMNVASGCPLFVAHTVLESPKYIKDDTLILKITVDLFNLQHP